MIKYILFLFIVTVSCAGSKVNKAKHRIKLTPISISSLIEKILDHQEYKYYSAKGTVSYSGSDFEGSADAHLKLIKDSIALIVIRKFGIELSRILLTPDTVTILDRIENTYQKRSFNEWTAPYNLPIDYQMLQDILTTGFYLGDYLHYELSDSNSYYLLKGHSELFSTSSQLIFAPIEPIKMIIEQSFRKAELNISKSIEIGKRKFPSQMLLTYNDLANLREHKIEIHWNQITLESPEAIKFEIPKHYSRI